MRCCSLEILATAGPARAGLLRLPHGQVRTPVFMPVGTAGTVKGLTPEEVRGAGSEMILANALHLWERPGPELVRALGGLHRMMGWEGPILTDSGGYQVFSFRERARVAEDGVRFQSPFDGRHRLLSPERAVALQEGMGVDVAMALDECLPWPAERDRVVASTRRTTRWLLRCRAARRSPQSTALFGIVQGGFDAGLRAEHARELAGMDLDGYAVGGLSVGEPREAMLEMLEVSTAILPADRPRYLMGVGTPADIAQAVLRGVDLFDCVLPTRYGRFGQLFTSGGMLSLKHARYRDDPRPIDPECPCYTCRSFSRAYLRHLHTSRELLAPRLLTLHNLTFYQRFMERLREAVTGGTEAVQALATEARRWQGPLPPDGTSPGGSDAR